MSALLEVRDLTVTFSSRDRTDVVAVDGVSFDLARGLTRGLVGESGSGKSVTSLAVMGLLPKRGVRIGGSVKLDGEELLTATDERRRDLRGKAMAMVFQDPMSSLNPVVPIGIQVAEVLQRHEGASKKTAFAESEELLQRVGIPDPKRRLKDYPHQLSGGMRQRALIAMALAAKPSLLIADEPTTALDVTIQAQILDLLRTAVQGSDTALLLITHDLGIVAGMCDDVSVMYSGRLVEEAARRPLFRSPHHPYTAGLLASIPRLDSRRGSQLTPVPGSPADTLPWTSACAFAPRCSRSDETCRSMTPPLEPLMESRLRCFHPVDPPGSLTATRPEVAPR